MAIALSATAQQTPTNKTRSNSDYSQVDNYLIGLKRLGIPTSETDNLDASGLPQNTVKIIYNTTLGRLRIYNPLTATWSDANPSDLTPYYTKVQVDDLLATTNRFIKNWHAGFEVDTANIFIKGGINVRALDSSSQTVIASDAISTTSYSGNYADINLQLKASNLTSSYTGSLNIDAVSGLNIGGGAVTRWRGGRISVENETPDYTGRDGYFAVLGKNEDPQDANYSTLQKSPNVAKDNNVIHRTGDETKKGRLFLSDEGDINPVYLAVQEYNSGYGIIAGSNGVVSLSGDRETDLYGGLKIQNYNSKGNAPIFLNSGANGALINYTSEDYFSGENNQLQLRNFSAGSDAAIVFKTAGNSFQINNSSFQINNLEEKTDDSFAPLLAYIPSNGHVKKIEDKISLRPGAINSSALGTATSIRVVPVEGGSQVGARHEIGFSSWNTHGTTQYGIGGRVTDVSGNESSDLYLYNNGAERLIVGSDGKVSVPNDVEISDLTKGIIMKSPNGTRYRITINDAGDFVKTAL